MSNEREQRAARAEQMRKEREKADRKQRNLISVGIVTVVVVLIAVAGYAITSSSNDNKKNDKVVQPANATADYGIVYSAGDAGGAAPAGSKPVQVEVYEDFQCPVCQQFEQTSSSFLKAQVKSGAIDVVYKPFSFLDDTGGSPNDYSKRSTNVAICALDEGGVTDYVKVHDYLYANQPEERTPGPESSELLAAVKDLGITGLDSCVKTEKFIPWIKKARDVGSEAGVTGTPTVKIAGQVVENPTPEGLQAAITAASAA